MSRPTEADMLAEPRAVLSRADAATITAALDTLGFLYLWLSGGGGELAPEDLARIDRELRAARAAVEKWGMKMD